MAATAPYVLHPLHPDGLGAAVLSLRTRAAITLNVNWPAANLALFWSFVTHVAISVQTFWWLNGNAVNGNVDMGIYTVAGGRLALLDAPVAQAGASVVQTASKASAYSLAAGAYLMAISCSSGTARIGQIDTIAAETLRALGCVEDGSGHPLPAPSASLNAYTRTMIPFCGIVGSGGIT